MVTQAPYTRAQTLLICGLFVINLRWLVYITTDANKVFTHRPVSPVVNDAVKVCVVVSVGCHLEGEGWELEGVFIDRS